MYVDDTTLLDVVDMGEATRHLSTATTLKELNNLALANDFETLKERAGGIGMKINEKKTQLLVISPPNVCTTSGVIQTEEGDLWTPWSWLVSPLEPRLAR